MVKNQDLLLLFYFLVWIVPAGAVTCVHCKDTIAGCEGGDLCPLITDLASNVALFAEPTLGTTPSLANMLPAPMRAIFSPTLCEAIVGIATAPSGGVTADLSDTTTYPNPAAVIASR